MSKVGIGVIGVGRMGQTHAAAVARQTNGARLIAVADARRDAAKHVAEVTGAKTYYDNVVDLLQNPEIQGVVIATPSNSHLELIKLAAAAGKDILCEKPIALTLEETEEAIEITKKYGVRLQVGFMRRFDSGVREARKAIADGTIGIPVSYKALQRDESAPPAAFCDPKKSGGIISDMGIHEIDAGRYLLGQEVTEVWAVPGPIVDENIKNVGDHDNVFIQLRYSGGAVGHIELSRNARYGDDVRFEIVGSDAAIFWGDLPRQQLVIGRSGQLQTPTVLSFVDRFIPAWTAQIASFAHAIENDLEPEVGGEDAKAAISIALAAEHSLKTGKSVLLSEMKHIYI